MNSSGTQSSPKPSQRALNCGSLAPKKGHSSEPKRFLDEKQGPIVSDWDDGLAMHTPPAIKAFGHVDIIDESPIKNKKGGVMNLNSVKKKLYFEDNRMGNAELMKKVNAIETQKRIEPAKVGNLLKLR